MSELVLYGISELTSAMPLINPGPMRAENTGASTVARVLTQGSGQSDTVIPAYKSSEK